MLPKAPKKMVLEEGAQFIRDHIIRVTDKAFDDFAAAGTDALTNRRILGLD